MDRTINKYSRMCLLLIVFTLLFCVKFSDDAYAATEVKPGKVVINKISSVNYNTVKITWSKAKNAKKYELYRAVSLNGKYKLIKTTTSRSYVNSGLETGKKYYYKVRAVNGKKYGKYSNKKSIIPKLNKSTLQLTSKNYNSVRLSWTKVKGAKSYNIYRATAKNGKYVKIKNTTATSFTNSGLKTGTKYYYNVKAVRNKCLGPASSIKSIVLKLKKPVIHVQEYDLGELYIYWDAVIGASGYEIYSATSKSGTYKKVTTTLECDYYDESVKEYNTYYYKVKAYRMVDGKKVYSSFSDIESSYVNGDPTDDIDVVSHDLSNGSILLEVTNNSQVNTYVDFKIVFWDASGNFIAIEEPQLQYMRGKGVSYLEVYKPTDSNYKEVEYSYYTIDYTATAITYWEPYDNQIEIIEGIGDTYSKPVQIVNNSNVMLDYVGIAAVFYDENGKVVDYDWDQITNLKRKSSDFLELYSFEEYDEYEIIPIYAIHYLI